MSAEPTSLPSPSADGASSESGRATPIVGAGGRWVLHTRGDRSIPPAMKYTMNGTKIEREVEPRRPPARERAVVQAPPTDDRVRTNIGNVATLDDAVAAFNPTKRFKGKTIIRVHS
jgi:hypothetical protein